EGHVLGNGEDAEDRRLVDVLELELAKLGGREARGVVGTEDLRLEHRERDVRVVERLEPENQSIVARIDQAELGAFGKPEKTLGHANLFIVPNRELSKTSCFNDHAQPRSK